MVGSPPLQPAPYPSADTCVRVVTRPGVAESVSSSLDLMLGRRDQGGSEETVVAAVDQLKDFTCNFNTHQQLHSY